MTSISELLGFANLGLALVIVALAVPLILGKVPRNALYGARFAKAFESDEAWYAVNRYAGWQLIAWAGVPLVILGAVCLYLPLGEQRPALTIVLALLPGLLVLVPCWTSWRFAKRI